MRVRQEARHDPGLGLRSGPAPLDLRLAERAKHRKLLSVDF
jgi:hypothetical protein